MAKAKAKTKANPYQQHEDALRKKQSELLASYKRDKLAGSSQADDGIQDLADKAASAYSKELSFSLSDTERTMLMQIDEALDRMKESLYGVCANCSVTIGEKRLEAIPWTSHCIDCQELQEKGMLN